MLVLAVAREHRYIRARNSLPGRKEALPHVQTRYRRQKHRRRRALRPAQKAAYAPSGRNTAPDAAAAFTPQAQLLQTPAVDAAEPMVQRQVHRCQKRPQQVAGRQQDRRNYRGIGTALPKTRNENEGSTNCKRRYVHQVFLRSVRRVSKAHTVHTFGGATPGTTRMPMVYAPPAHRSFTSMNAAASFRSKGAWQMSAAIGDRQAQQTLPPRSQDLREGMMSSSQFRQNATRSKQKSSNSIPRRGSRAVRNIENDVARSRPESESPYRRTKRPAEKSRRVKWQE